MKTLKNTSISNLRRRSLFMLVFFSLTLNSHAQIWEKVQTTLNTVGDIHSIDDKLVIAGGAKFATSDNGIDWEVLDLSPQLSGAQATFVTLGFFDSQNGLILIRDNSSSIQNILSTNDGGLSWEFANVGFEDDCFDEFIPFKFHILNEESAFIQLLAGGAIYSTNDKGKTWECNTDFYPEAGLWFSISVVSESEWYVATATGHFKTEDAGANYTRLVDKSFSHVQREENGDLYGLSFQFNEPSNLNVLYKTSDDWQTYDSIPLTSLGDENLTLFIVLSEDEIMVPVKSDEIYYSKDGGQNFTHIQTLIDAPIRTVKIEEDWYLAGRGLWKLNATYCSENSGSEETFFYPNPTKDFIYLTDARLTNYTIHLANGQLLGSGIIDELKIDLSPLSAGLYYITIFNEEKSFVNRVVKIYDF